MLARGGDTCGAALLGAAEHEAAYEGSTPGATVARAWGILELRRRSSGTRGGVGGGVGDGGGGASSEEYAPREKLGHTVPEASTSASVGMYTDGNASATRRCHDCGAMSCAGAAAHGVCPSADIPVLHVEGIEWSLQADDDDARSDERGMREAGDGKERGGTGGARVDARGCWIVFDMAYDATMTAAEHGALSRQVRGSNPMKPTS
jgi:hypothetical protein